VSTKIFLIQKKINIVGPNEKNLEEATRNEKYKWTALLLCSIKLHAVVIHRCGYHGLSFVQDVLEISLFVELLHNKLNIRHNQYLSICIKCCKVKTVASFWTNEAIFSYSYIQAKPIKL